MYSRTCLSFFFWEETENRLIVFFFFCARHALHHLNFNFKSLNGHYLCDEGNTGKQPVNCTRNKARPWETGTVDRGKVAPFSGVEVTIKVSGDWSDLYRIRSLTRNRRLSVSSKLPYIHNVKTMAYPTAAARLNEARSATARNRAALQQCASATNCFQQV